MCISSSESSPTVPPIASHEQKHFIALADFIRTHNVKVSFDCPHVARFDSEHLTTLCAFIASASPRFNRARWLNYILATTNAQTTSE
jgi:hypothetical protein